MLPIVYQDEAMVAINKPHGLLVHRSPIAADASEFAVQLLRDQLGQRVFPVHRLDRKTSGILLFALNEETNSLLQRGFAEGKIHKTYLAIVRGYTEVSFEIDYPLQKEEGIRGCGTLQEAFTSGRTLGRVELPFSQGKHESSRYSIVELTPTTGRMHQLRKHMAHVFHPIIGDRPHGCNKQNRFFKEQFGLTSMLLHASELRLVHPIHQTKVCLTAPLSDEFIRIKTLLGL